MGHIYACGDVTGQVMLANTAAVHGRAAALHALGIEIEPVAYSGVAWCVFTRPEIAKAGISERQARLDGIPVRVTKHLIRANPRAVMEGETDGMIKLISDPDDGTILGGAMVGFRASEVITAVALAVHAEALGAGAGRDGGRQPVDVGEPPARGREGRRGHARHLPRDPHELAQGSPHVASQPSIAMQHWGLTPLLHQTSMRRPGWAISIGPEYWRRPAR